MRATFACVVCAALLITTACSADPTDDSLETRTEDGVIGESTSLPSENTAEDNTAEDNAGDGDAVATTDGDGPEAAAAAEQPTTDVGEEVGEILVATGEDLTGEALEEHIARRFEAFWLAFDIARSAPTATPETDYPAIFELSAGTQLERSYADLKELHRSGQAIREPGTPAVAGLTAATALRVRVDSVDAGVAELTSCLVNDQIRYEVATGVEVGNNVTTVMAVSTMAKTDGSWKLIRSEPIALDQGVAGCWLEDAPGFEY